MHHPFMCVVTLTAALGSAVPATAVGQSEDITTSVQAETVPEAVATISEMLEQHGFEIALVVDHAAGAASVGLELPPTQVVLARPPHVIERALLRRNDTVGLDLPLKVLAFERDGMVHITTNSMGYITDRHDVDTKDIMIRLLDESLDPFDATADGLVTVKSLQSLEDTVLSLEAAISANPAFRIPLVLDYSRNNATGGPVLIVFGNPNAGTPLMQTQQEIGIDLPQKYWVWEDDEGTVNVTYNDPFFIAARHDVEGQDERLTAMSGALMQFALIGAGQAAGQ